MLNTCFLLLLGFLPSEAESLTAEELVSRHLHAIGGEKQWAAIETMKITGGYESFSNSHPFTIYRKRPDLYRFEHFMIEFDVVCAYDGEKAWWINPMMGQAGQKPGPIFEPQNKITVRESVFDNVLFGYKEKGHTIKLLGMEKLEGEPHYQLEVSIKDGPVETWHINAKTFLRTLVITDGYEYGRKASMDVFYGDYRKVNGVMMPFYIEQEWHTRHRVFEIEKIEVNVPVDDKLFVMATE